MSAANAEVVRPATISNGKATLFITSPFDPLADGGSGPSTRKRNLFEKAARPDMRGSKTVMNFSILLRPAKIKTSANSAFLCFRWKTSQFVRDCGGWDTPWAYFVRAAFDGADSRFSHQ